MFVYLILSTFLFLLIPENVFAWGPGTHIEIALSLLEKAALFAPVARAIIAGREEWFVYGNIAADIIVGKKFAGHLHHCHNWLVGQEVLKAARTDRERAAAYGYLSHLAADIVAHNYFIPFKVMKSYSAKLLSHTYWETRFDLHVKPLAWKELSRMILHDFSPFDHLLEKKLHRALFSFKTSKTIFSGILAMHRFNQFHKAISVYAKRSRWKLDKSDCAHYMRLAHDISLGFLSNPKEALCVNCDPTGAEKLSYAKAVRREIKKGLKKKLFTEREVERRLCMIKLGLYKDIKRCI